MSYKNYIGQYLQAPAFKNIYIYENPYSDAVLLKKYTTKGGNISKILSIIGVDNGITTPSIHIGIEYDINQTGWVLYQKGLYTVNDKPLFLNSKDIVELLTEARNRSSKNLPTTITNVTKHGLNSINPFKNINIEKYLPYILGGIAAIIILPKLLKRK